MKSSNVYFVLGYLRKNEYSIDDDGEFPIDDFEREFDSLCDPTCVIVRNLNVEKRYQPLKSLHILTQHNFSPVPMLVYTDETTLVVKFSNILVDFTSDGLNLKIQQVGDEQLVAVSNR